MRRILAVLGLICVALWCLWTWGYHQQPLNVLFKPPAPDPLDAYADAMLKRATVVAEDVLLSEVLRALEEQTGVAIAVAPLVVNPDPLIRLELHDAPLASIVGWIARDNDLVLTLRNGQLQLSEEPLVTRPYLATDLPQHLDAEHLGTLLFFWDTAMLDTEAYDGEYESAAPSGVLVESTLAAHYGVQRLLPLLEQPDFFNTRPRLLSPPLDESALEALKTEVVFNGETLERDDAIAAVARQAGLTLFIGDNYKDRLLLRGAAPASAWLDALRAEGVGWTLWGKTVVVDQPSRISDEIKAYPVGDLWENQPDDDVREFVHSLVDQQQWTDYGGAFESCQLGQLLLVRGTTGLHLRLEQLLDACRRLRSAGNNVGDDQPVWERRDEPAWRQLQARMDSEYVDAELGSILADLTLHARLPVVIAIEQFDDDIVSLKTRIDMPRRGHATRAEALDAALEPLEVEAVLLSGGVVWVGERDFAGPMARSLFRIPSWCNEASAEDRRWAMYELAQLQYPEDWEEYGGDGIVRGVDDYIGVSQRPRHIVELGQAIVAIGRLQDSGPIWINQPRRAELLKKLDQPVELQFQGRPLIKAAWDIEHQTGVPIITRGITSGSEVSGHFSGVPLRAALTELLGRSGFTWELHDAGLVFQPAGEDVGLTTAAFKLDGDLLEANDRRISLADVARNAVDLWSWEENGGQGRSVTIGNVHVVHNTWRVVERVDRFLEQLQRSQRELPALPQEAPPMRVSLDGDMASRNALQRWERRVTLETKGLDVEQCIERLREKVQAPVVTAAGFFNADVADMLLLNLPARRVLEELRAEDPRKEVPTFVMRDGVVIQLPEIGPAFPSHVLLGDARTMPADSVPADSWGDLLYSFDNPRWPSGPSFGVSIPVEPRWVVATRLFGSSGMDYLKRWGTDVMMLSGPPDVMSRYRRVVSLIRRAEPPRLEELPGWDAAVEVAAGSSLVEAVTLIAEQSGLPLSVPSAEPLRGRTLEQPLRGAAGPLLEQIADRARLRFQRFDEEARMEMYDPFAGGTVDAQLIDIQRVLEQPGNWTPQAVVDAIHESVDPQSWTSSFSNGFFAGTSSQSGYLLPVADRHVLVVHTPRVCADARSFVDLLAGKRPTEAELAEMLAGNAAERAAAVWSLAKIEPSQATRQAAHALLASEVEPVPLYQVTTLLLSWEPDPDTDLQRIGQLLDRLDPATPTADRLRTVAKRLGAAGGVMLGKRLVVERPKPQQRRRQILHSLRGNPDAALAALPYLLRVMLLDGSLTHDSWITINEIPDHEAKVKAQIMAWQQSDDPQSQGWSRALRAQLGRYLNLD